MGAVMHDAILTPATDAECQPEAIAFSGGRAAGKSGASTTSNPYREEEETHQMWLDGWEQGFFDRRFPNAT